GGTHHRRAGARRRRSVDARPDAPVRAGERCHRRQRRAVAAGDAADRSVAAHHGALHAGPAGLAVPADRPGLRPVPHVRELTPPPRPCGGPIASSTLAMPSRRAEFRTRTTSCHGQRWLPSTITGGAGRPALVHASRAAWIASSRAASPA